MDFPLFKAPIFYLNPPSIESQSISVRSPISSSFERRFSHAISCRRMSCELETAPPTLRTVTISYSELQDKDGDLSMKIENGFGPNGLGIISVSDVPGFPLLRYNLLRLSPRLASLPEEAKKELEDPDSRYGFGWSHGKETLESGKLDMLKGSFYANPVLDIPTTEASLMQRYPSYCRPNIWPSNALPKLEEAFKALGKLMLDVGLMLGYHCDRYVTKVDPFCNDESLKQILLRSRCHKGRLLYYFPAQQSDCTQDLGNMSSWCGWHTDHGSLTAYFLNPKYCYNKKLYTDNELKRVVHEVCEHLFPNCEGKDCSIPRCSWNVWAPSREGVEDHHDAMLSLEKMKLHTKLAKLQKYYQEVICVQHRIVFRHLKEKRL